MKFFIPSSFQNVVKEGINNGDYFLKICGAGGGGFMPGFTGNRAKASEGLKAFSRQLFIATDKIKIIKTYLPYR